MLRQSAVIDVRTWVQDAEFGIFPQGARAKEAFFSPSPAPEAFLTPAKRYLFKRSKGSYPDQFWGEVVAYRIGCLLGLDVPPAFVAWNSDTGICAALIEWFYIDGEEACVLAGDFLTKVQPGFDRDKGTQHNLRDVTVLLRALSSSRALPEDIWKKWWINALVFDALIGNTDRHQDNWALLFRPRHVAGAPICRLSPLFDNGTSLGHERFTDRVANWVEADFSRYVSKGKHQISWSLEEEPRIRGHLQLLEHAMQEWPGTREEAAKRIARVSEDAVVDVISDLPHLDCAIRLSPERFAFICKLLRIRLNLIRDLLS